MDILPDQTLPDIERSITRIIAENGVANANNIASLFIQEVVSLDRTGCILADDLVMTRAEQIRLLDMVTRLLRGEPVQRILGNTEFWGLKYRLSPDTFIPRPETEILVEVALSICFTQGSRDKIRLDYTEGSPDRDKTRLDDTEGSPDRDKTRLDDTEGSPDRDKTRLDDTEGSPDRDKIRLDDTEGSPNRDKTRLDDTEGSPDRDKTRLDDTEGSPDRDKIRLDDQKTSSDRDQITFADLGTGSGAILVAILREQPIAYGIGIDISYEAIKTAAANLLANGVGNRSRLHLDSFENEIPARDLDFIVSNPPYIPSSDIDNLAPEVRYHDPVIALDGGKDGLDAYRSIIPRAINALKSGGRLILEIGHMQSEAVRSLLSAHGFSEITVFQDLQGDDRVLSAVRPSVLSSLESG